jgi:hypothetical protein
MAFKLSTGKLPSLVLLCACLLAHFTTMKAQRTSSAQDERRMRPPDVITCDRNHLTSYTGKVLSYSRRTGRTTLSIRTDWDTTETVTLNHPRSSNPAKWFLLRGETFKQSDWATIESSRSNLKPNMRVTAWVCDDGRNPIIDWQPSTTAPRSTP